MKYLWFWKLISEIFFHLKFDNDWIFFLILSSCIRVTLRERTRNRKITFSKVLNWIRMEILFNIGERRRRGESINKNKERSWKIILRGIHFSMSGLRIRWKCDGVPYTFVTWHVKSTSFFLRWFVIKASFKVGFIFKLIMLTKPNTTVYHVMWWVQMPVHFYPLSFKGLRAFFSNCFRIFVWHSDDHSFQWLWYGWPIQPPAFQFGTCWHVAIEPFGLMLDMWR